MANVIYDGGDGTTLTGVVITGTLTFTTAGTYELIGCTINEVINTSGGNVILQLDSASTVTTNTGPDITLGIAQIPSEINATNLNTVQIVVLDDSGALIDDRTAFSGTYSYTLPPTATGSWKLGIKRAGYEEIIRTFSATNDNVNIVGPLVERELSDGSIAYTNTTSPFLTVESFTDGSRINLRVSDGTVPPRAVFDMIEDHVSTVAGLRFLTNTPTGKIDLVLLPIGNVLFFGNNMRALIDVVGQDNAAIGSYVESRDGQPRDTVNGSVEFLQISDADRLGAFFGAVWVDTSSPYSGTLWPAGTLSRPVNNVADAVDIANTENIQEIAFLSDATIAEDISGLKVGSKTGYVTLTLGVGNVCNRSAFANCRLTGVMNGDEDTSGVRVDFTSLTGIDGDWTNVRLKTDDLALATTAKQVMLELSNSFVAGTGKPSISMAGTSNCGLNVRGYNGGFRLRDCTNATNAVSLDMIGSPEIHSSCTAGEIIIRGQGVPIVNNGTMTLNDSGWVVPLTQATVQAYLDAYTNKDNWKADVSAIETKAEADARQAILIAEIDTRATPSDVNISGTPTSYPSTTFTRTVGSDEGGDLTEIQALDGTFAHTGETLSGLEVLVAVTSSSVDENPSLVRIHGFYSSNTASHELDIQVWNFTLSQWENRGVMCDRSSSFGYIVPLRQDDHDGITGEMRLRIIHNVVSPYKTQHTLSLDYVGFEKVGSNSAIASDIAQIITNQQQLLEENKITSGTVVSATANSVTLDSSASSEDAVYDPAIIKITSGAGAGQSRIILQYFGATKIAVLNRDWRELPNTSSKYVIEQFVDLQSVNEGRVTSATANTLVLNDDASSQDDVYNDQFIFIVSGTGQDQTGLIKDYDGATKTATLEKNWITLPDAGAGYVIIPSSSVRLGEFTHTNAVIPNVTLVDTTTTNTDMRGTDGANTVAPDNAGILSAISGSNDITASEVATAVWTSVTRSLTDKVDFDLTTASKNQLVVDIEAALINEGDGQQLIDAILQVINANLDLPALELQAIASQVRTELAVELARIDANISDAGLDESDLHDYLDSYSNKDDWKASSVDLSPVLTAISNLNNLSTGDIDARLTAYGLPTLTEMTDAFTEIKGAGWTATDTLEAIRDAVASVASGAVTPAQVWAHVTRTLTAGTKDAEIDAIKVATDNLPADPASATNVAAVLTVTQLLEKYHDNNVKYFGADGTTEVIQSSAYQMVVYDNDGTTPLKTILFKDALGDPAAITAATRYEKL